MTFIFYDLLQSLVHSHLLTGAVALHMDDDDAIVGWRSQISLWNSFRNELQRSRARIPGNRAPDSLGRFTALYWPSGTFYDDPPKRFAIDLLGHPIETGPVGSDQVPSFVIRGNFIETYHLPESGRLAELTLCGAAGAAGTSVRRRSS